MRQAVDIGELMDQVGREIGVSLWHRIDQATINAFADATGDHQYIHVDPARAAQTPFGGTIAHGLLTLSLSAVMFHEAGRRSPTARWASITASTKCAFSRR